MTKLIVTFRNFANAPRNGWYFSLPLAPVLNTHIQSHTMDIKHSRPRFKILLVPFVAYKFSQILWTRSAKLF